MSAPRPVLLTGASGRLGHGLAARLAAAGVALRLTDRHPFPGPLPPGASFTQQDLGDAGAIAELAAGCGTILHFGGVPNEVPGFESILDANLRGCFHVYEAARVAGARVVFASSNHAFGFHPRPGEAAARLEVDCAYRPDTFYGLSKVYGEQMGRLYWDKHAVESVQLRIGSCTETPQDARALATWFSHGDLARCCLAAIVAPRTGWAVIWGASANPASFWGGDDRGLLGWEPQDSAEAWLAEIAGRVSADPLVERFQGGAFCALDWPPGRPRG